MFENDPVLRWLPDEPPDDFLLMDPKEQAFRGRIFIVLYGAGYEQDHAWWLALGRNASFDASAREMLKRLRDSDYGEMVKGRAYTEQELARQAALGGQ